MKVAIYVIVGFLLTEAMAETPSRQANVISTSFQQCRQERSGRYEVYLSGTVEIKNTSNSPILVSRRIDLVRTVTVSSSRQDATQEKYIWVMTKEFGPNKDQAPQLSNFITIKPGDKASIELEPFELPATVDANDHDVRQLRPGKYWLRLEFFSLPASFPWSARDDAKWKRKWSLHGRLVTEYIFTEPFPVDLALDPSAATCSSL